MKIRKILIFLSFFLLPVTLNYFSPVLIVQAGFERTFSIMHIVYIIMLLAATIFGAAWCSYICPFGAMQELLPGKITKPRLFKSKFPNLKFITGGIWLLLILWPVILYGIKQVNIFYHMEDTKVTMDSFHGLILYYIITGGILLISAVLGRRIWCRYLCPMYIFNYIGISISKLLHLPGLSISADTGKCVKCGQCDNACLMDLKVTAMVSENKWNRTECIQCGECISACRQCALKRTFK